MSAAHISVLLAEVTAALEPRDGAVFVDGTFGAGGYSRALLDAAPCRVFGIDRDPVALAKGRDLAKSYDGRLTVMAGCFSEMERLLADESISEVDGVALDLGVSSMQIDDATRGFSFAKEGPLDMRMGQDGETAADLVNTLGEEKLADIIWRYGEERLSRRVARAVVAERKTRPFATTMQLADLVRRVVPRSKDGIDPATRTFQALRIAVNDELGEVERGLASAERVLKEGGCLAVVSFHSLEDRAVKTFLKSRSGTAARPSRHMPVTGENRAPTFELINSKPIRPTDAETDANPRARSARLRSARRTGSPAWPAEGALS